MPTMPRQMSVSGTYHVMLRGNNREKVFIDRLDIKKFLFILGDLKKEYNFNVFAYCFMSNHIHLLLREPECGLISKFMQKLECRFVRWYNAKYDRCGHLFQNRFKSEVVEDLAYFKTLVRYIHNNPVKAGLVSRASDYADSSFRCFFSDNNTLIDREYVFEAIAQPEFAFFHFCPPAPDEESRCIELGETLKPRVIDEYSFEIMQTLSACYNGAQLLGTGLNRLFECIRQFRMRGLTYKQIGQFLSRSKSTVFKWAMLAC